MLTSTTQRNFRFLSIFGFSMILMQAWESVLAVGSIGLTNGGTAGYVWMFLVCWIGFGFVNTSMAEMGSMAPTTGGQVRRSLRFHLFPSTQATARLSRGKGIY